MKNNIDATDLAKNTSLFGELKQLASSCMNLITVLEILTKRAMAIIALVIFQKVGKKGSILELNATNCKFATPMISPEYKNTIKQTTVGIIPASAIYNALSWSITRAFGMAIPPYSQSVLALGTDNSFAIHQEAGKHKLFMSFHFFQICPSFCNFSQKTTNKIKYIAYTVYPYTLVVNHILVMQYAQSQWRI